ncbi:RNA-directed DNA polymerase, eukaryota, reverse transcriptase zinc-binding domain protein [Tanacetum coccineum]
MERMEPKKLLVWVKIVNVPLEAWSIEGISALASSLGKPIMMDTMTANMCYKGVGKFEYARVLVEIDAEKEIKREIKIQYRGQNNNIKGSKKLKVVYDWKPPACTKCKEYRKKQVDDTNNEKNKTENVGMKNKWNVKEKEVDDLRKTANKYYVLDSLPEDNDQELRMLKERMIVDKFLDKKLQPTLIESMSWSKDMIKYFKEKWEEDRQKEHHDVNNEVVVKDVINLSSGTTKVMVDNEVNGMEDNVLNEEFYGV